MPKVIDNLDRELLLYLKETKGYSIARLALHFNVSERTIKTRLRGISGNNQTGDLLNYQNIPAGFAVHPDDRVSDFATKLQKLEAYAPDGLCRKELQRAVNFIRTRHNVSREKRKSEILHSIATGGQTLEDIAADCGLNAEEFVAFKSELVALLDELIAERRIEKRRAGGVLNRGRKTKYYYFLVSA